jgi:hypothetical protein
MDKFNLLVVLIQAYQNACKDFHYFCDSYALHLLADEVNSDDFYDIIDSIKENVFIAEGKDPLSAKKYAEATAKATPETKDTDEGNLKQLLELANRIEEHADSIEPEMRAFNVILDSVAEKMAHAKTLLKIELRKAGISESMDTEISEGINTLINEAKEVLKVEKKGTETPVDRKEVKVAKIDSDKVMRTIKDYEAKNLLVAEENTLDKLERKLGI